MDLTEQIIDEAGKRLARDIDTEILMSMMGWHEMKISTGTVYDQTYHTVKPPSRFLTPTPDGWYDKLWADMEDWCTETFGDTPKDGVWTPDSRWYMNNRKFWFKDEADLLLFTLRWS
jgi:hypothetical protein